MTEVLIVLATAVAAFFLVDPFYNGALVITALAKGSVLIACGGSLLFHLVGRAIFAADRLRQALVDMVADWWPLLALCVFILAGSIYGIYVDDVRESFRGMGLGMMFLPLVALAVGSADKPMLLVKGLAAVHLLMSATMFGFLFFTDHVFHESIFLTVPLGAYFLVDKKPRLWQLMLGLLLIGACTFSFKNTTFLMMLASLAVCALIWLLRLARGQQRLTAVTLLYFAVVLAIVCLAAVLFAWLRYRSALPTGNVEYRVEMYRIAWWRFLDSPVWGTLFTDSAVNYFTLYKVAQGTQNLPTHSDILDILAHGGLIGIGLWAGAIWRIVAIGWSAISTLSSPDDGRDLRAWRWLFVLFLVQVNAIITYAVNPPMINPVPGFWIWGTAGVMWALHRLLVRGLPKPSAEPVVHALGRAWA